MFAAHLSGVKTTKNIIVKIISYNIDKGFPYLFQILLWSCRRAVSKVSVIGGQRGGLRVYRLLIKSKICLHNMPL